MNQITKKNGEATSDDKEAAEVLCETFKEGFVTNDRVTDDSKTGVTGQDDERGRGKKMYWLISVYQQYQEETRKVAAG